MEAAHNAKPLKWEGGIVKNLLHLTWPLVLSSLSFNLMNLINTLLVSHAGTAELAGAGFGSMVGFMLLSFAYGVLRGAKTLTSQAVGAGRSDRIAAYQGGALTFALISGFIILALAEVVALGLPLVTASADAGEASRLYLAVGMLAAPIMVWNTSLREICLGEGDSRTPMIATVVSNITNIAVAWFALFVMHWGIIGAAVATICAHCMDCVVLTRSQYRRHGFAYVGNPAALKELWKLGCPCGFQMCLESGSFTLIGVLIAGFGKEQMASHQIALNIVQFCLLPVGSLAESGSVLSGQAVGAGRQRLCMRVAHLCVLCASIFSVACGAGVALFPSLTTSLFTEDPALLAATSSLLLMAAAFLVVDSTNMVARSALRSVGDLKVPALVGVVCSWFLTLPLTWLLGHQLGLGIHGAWLGLCCQTVVSSTVLWLRLEYGRWQYTAAAVSAPERVAA